MLQKSSKKVIKIFSTLVIDNHKIFKISKDATENLSTIIGKVSFSNYYGKFILHPVDFNYSVNNEWKHFFLYLYNKMYATTYVKKKLHGMQNPEKLITCTVNWNYTTAVILVIRIIFKYTFTLNFQHKCV